jgi:dihydroxyacid dehydratase/phosphogluconate dehydratase
VLRSAYPIILSVGGWLLGALIVLATMPSVPVDDELLVALSVGWPGTLSADQFTRSESAMIRSRRHCNTMGTASTGARRRGARHGRPGRRRHTRG